MGFNGFSPKVGCSCLASDGFLGPGLGLCCQGLFVCRVWSVLVLIQPRGCQMKRRHRESRVSGDQAPRQKLHEIETSLANL